MPTKAWEIPSGRAVVHTCDGQRRICIKIHRVGKEYVHHYVIPLYPRVEPMRLVYVDPDEVLVDIGQTIRLGAGAGEAGRAEPGDIFESDKGRFLKVIEDPKSQKTFAFIEIESFELFRRRERGVQAVFRQWDARGDETLVDLHARFCAP